MPLSREEVQHVALLARVGLSEADIEKFQGQLSQILDYFEVLKQVDTEGVPPTAHVLPLQNVMRPDEVAPSLPQEEILANAPQVEEGHFRVHAILE